MRRFTCVKCKKLKRARADRSICRKCAGESRPNRAMKRIRVKKEKTNTPPKSGREKRAS